MTIALSGVGGVQVDLAAATHLGLGVPALRCVVADVRVAGQVGCEGLCLPW